MRAAGLVDDAVGRIKHETHDVLCIDQRGAVQPPASRREHEQVCLCVATDTGPCSCGI